MADKYINFQEKSELIYDGIETNFLGKINSVKCPFCEGTAQFSLANSISFDELNAKLKIELAKKITGVREVHFPTFTRFKYKGASIRTCETHCNQLGHALLINFSWHETQPARYLSFLVGIFAIRNDDC